MGFFLIVVEVGFCGVDLTLSFTVSIIPIVVKAMTVLGKRSLIPVESSVVKWITKAS